MLHRPGRALTVISPSALGPETTVNGRIIERIAVTVQGRTFDRRFHFGFACFLCVFISATQSIEKKTKVGGLQAYLAVSGLRSNKRAQGGCDNPYLQCGYHVCRSRAE